MSGFTRYLFQAPRRTQLEILLLLILVPLAVFLGTAPLRTRRALQHASLADLEARARLDPSDEQVQYYLARRARQEGQFQLALDAYRHAAEPDLSNEVAWIEWAHTTADTGNIPLAIGLLKTFCHNNPSSATAHIALAEIFLQGGSPRPALEEASAATKIAPRLAEAWSTQAKIALAMEYYEQAREALGQAIALAPNDWHGYAELGNVEAARKRFPEAIAHYRQAVALAPENGTPELMLGRTLLQAGSSPADWAEAQQHLERAAALEAHLSPQDRFALDLSLGQCYAQQARWSEALPWLQRAASLMSEDTTVHYLLARVYRELGDDVHAAQEIHAHEVLYTYRTEHARLLSRLRAAPQDRQARLRLARLLAAHGEAIEAAKEYRTLLQQAPDMAAVRQEMEALPHSYAGTSH